jgi:two-component system cell cycle sensor histidine kinase/response regulator CckA
LLPKVLKAIAAGLLVTGLAVFLFVSTPALADELTPEERSYLQKKEIITFISQTHYPPFEFLGEDGDHTGMCIDLVRWIATRYGFKTQFIDTSFKQAQQAVLGGKADVLTSLFFSEKRDHSFDFTRAIFQVPASIFVASDRPDIKDIKDLNGKTIAMQAGDYAQEYLESKRITFKGTWTKNFAEATDLVISGKADAIIGDEQIVLFHIYTNRLTHLIKKVGEPLYIGQNCMGLKEGNYVLQSILNKGIAAAIQTGTLKRINTTWIGVQFETGKSFLLNRYAYYFLAGAGLVLLAALLVWFWNIKLRSLVAKRTKSLKESEEKFRLLAEGMNDIIWITDGDLRTTYISPSVEKVLGFSPQEREQMSMEDKFTPESIERYQKLMDQEKKRDAEGADLHRPLVVEIEYYRKDGSTVWMENVMKRLWDANGRFIGLQGVTRDITKRIRAQEALQQSEKKFRFLAENMIDIVWTVDLNFHTTYVSPSVKAMLGFTPEERRQQSLAEMVTPESAQVVQEVFARELGRDANGADPNRAVKLEVEYYRKDGSTVWVENIVKAIRNADGQITGFHGVTRDISGRKQAEVEMRKLSQVVEQSPSSVVITDPEGNIEYVNPKFCELTGYSFEEAMGQNPRILKSGMNPSELYDGLWATITTGGEWRGELRNKKKSGDLYWETATISSIKAPDGTITHFLAVKEDITKQKLAQNDLIQIEQQYRELLESSSDLIYTQDLQGRFLSANPAIHKLFGFTLDEFLGRKASEFMDPKMEPLFRSEYLDALIEHGEHGGISKYSRKDGSKIYIEYRSKLVSPKNGEPYISGIGRDVTERIHAQREKIRLESELRQSQKMEAVGTLAGGIAHDFNNILSAIIGYSDLALQAAKIGKTSAENLEQILKASDRAKGLVEQILYFSHKGHSVLNPLDLNQQIIDISIMLERTIPKMISIDLRLDPNLRLINGDSYRIDQVLLNLATNAKDAMPDGGNLTIKTSHITLDEEHAKSLPDALPGEYALLTVTDTGVGMDKDTLDHIFEPFYTTKDIGSGTGLGLSSVYGIVKSHDGFMSCTSELQAGTTFQIFLPALPPEMRLNDSAEPYADTTPGGDETILLVDDEEFIRRLGQEALETSGYRVLKAQNGEEAVSIYATKSKAIDLIVLDISMPGMGGNKCLQKILSVNPKAKVVISSGYSLQGDLKESIELGAVAYLGKPFRMAELLKKIRQVLDD